MSLPAEIHARGGATSGEILRSLAPSTEGHTVGAVFAGANDLLTGVPADDFAANLSDLLDHLAGRSERLLTFTLPPRTGAFRLRGRAERVREINESIRRVADKHRAVVADLSEIHGPLLVSGDGVHLTAYGEREVAARAAVALGVEVPSRERRPDVALVRRYLRTRARLLAAAPVRLVR